VSKKQTTQEHLNKIIEFRQAIHANGFGKQRDALMEANITAFGQPGELGTRTFLDYLAYLPVISLHSIGGVDQSADLFGEFEEGSQFFPIVLPGTYSSTILISPGFFQLADPQKLALPQVMFPSECDTPRLSRGVSKERMTRS